MLVSEWRSGRTASRGPGPAPSRQWGAPVSPVGMTPQRFPRRAGAGSPCGDGEGRARRADLSRLPPEASAPPAAPPLGRDRCAAGRTPPRPASALLAWTQGRDLGSAGPVGRGCGERGLGSRGHSRSCSSFLPSQDQERRTPLHAAAYVGDVPILQLLLMSGESGRPEGVASGRDLREEPLSPYPRLVLWTLVQARLQPHPGSPA